MGNNVGGVPKFGGRLPSPPVANPRQTISGTAAIIPNAVNTPKPPKAKASRVNAFGHGGLGHHAAMPQTRTVAVKAHTRTVTSRPKAVPVPADPPASSSAPKALPPTHDKVPAPARNTAAATGPTPDPYASLLLYQGQSPQALAQAALAPQYAQVAQQQAAEQQGLKDFTTAILAQLGQYPDQVGTDYQQAADRINGYGQQAAQMLAALNPGHDNTSLLAAAGAPQAQQTQLAAQGQTDFGGAAANLYAANGALPAQTLEAQKAAALTYAQGLPQVQALAATQALKNLLYQGSQQRAQIGTQEPGLANQYAAAQAESATKVAALRQNDAALGIKAQQQTFNNRIAQDTLNYRRAAAEAGVKNAAGKINAGVSKVLGYVATSNGTPITTKDGKLIPVAASGAAGTPKVPTADEVSKLVDAWRNGKVQNVRVQATAKDGTPAFNPTTNAPVYISQSVQVGKVGYGQAYRRLLAMGVPEQKAREYLNTAYQRGQQGRSWVSNTEQQALLKAGLPPKARIVNGRGVLSRKQADALRRAGLLPAGQPTSDGFYVIAQGY